jgi:hypothetical protein
VLLVLLYEFNILDEIYHVCHSFPHVTILKLRQDTVRGRVTHVYGRNKVITGQRLIEICRNKVIIGQRLIEICLQQIRKINKIKRNLFNNHISVCVYMRQYNILSLSLSFPVSKSVAEKLSKIPTISFISFPRI